MSESSGWKKERSTGRSAHWMCWIPLLGYYQPLCKAGTESSFYGSRVVQDSTHNKCRRCLKKRKEDRPND